MEIHLNILHTIRSKEKPEESQDKDYSCEKCDKSFDEKYNLNTHVKLVHEENVYKVYQPRATETYACNKCSLRFSSQDNLKEHKRVMQISFLSF